MFFSFVDELRAAGIPASMKEHLTLLEALDADVIAREAGGILLSGARRPS